MNLKATLLLGAVCVMSIGCASTSSTTSLAACEGEKVTMADMRSLATASEAYATDYNKYPDAQDLDALGKLLSPTYIRTLPRKDAWGKEIHYVASESFQGYRFTSAGPDGVFESNDDLIFEDGSFTQWPQACVQ